VVEVPKIDIATVQAQYPEAKAIQAPAKGQMLWEYDVVDTSKAPNLGDVVEEGDAVAYIQTIYGIEPVKAAFGGKVVATYPKQGDLVEKGEIIAFVN
jgi:pyruvate carboxylase subunit B